MSPAPAKSGDPSLGRCTQPEPLGFVDGPSVYGYVGRMISAVEKAVQQMAENGNLPTSLKLR
jgi:hypothetical protein